MSKLFQLKIQLKDIKPAIYRTVLIPGSANFFQLHKTIQDAMGWFDCHLFQFFKDRGASISIPDKENDWEEVKDAREIKLHDYFTEVKKTITYEYDFGDGWEHTVTLEKILDNENKINYPVCIKGKRNCPPEDCGGPWGYENLLLVIGDKKHPEHKETLEWTGGKFDPEAFHIDGVNTSLKKLKLKL
jgi:Plasmid pRiA4b ORF-3-like protein